MTTPKEKAIKLMGKYHIQPVTDPSGNIIPMTTGDAIWFAILAAYTVGFETDGDTRKYWNSVVLELHEMQAANERELKRIVKQL